MSTVPKKRYGRHFSMNMEEGPPPNKRPKTDGGTDMFQLLEESLPDELMSGNSGLSSSNNGFGMNPGLAASQSVQMSVSKSVLSPHSGPPLSTAQSHKHIAQLLQNSPKPGQTSSPGGTNSPRPQQQHTPHPQPSPLSAQPTSMQSPNAGTINVMRNNLKSPPAVLPRPNSRPNSAISATPSPRPVQMPMGTLNPNSLGTSIAVSNPMRPLHNQMQPNMGSHPMSMSQVLSQDKMIMSNGMNRMNQGTANLVNELQNDMGMGMGGPQAMNQQAAYSGQPRMPIQANVSMFPNSNSYGSYSNIQPGPRQMSVNSGGFNDPTMARPPSVSGGIVNQGVPNQNHVSNGIMMSDKTGDNMHMMQQQPNMAMMGNMDKSNLGMAQMRSSMSMVQPGNVQRQVTDMGGIMTQDNTQQQQQPIQVNANMLNSMNQPQGPGRDQMMGMAGRNQPTQSATSTGTPVDPEKRRLIQQQLVLLLHAYKCSKKEQNGESTNCALPHCKTMKDVLKHMNVCNDGKVCQVAHCASSRQIIAHWRSCNRPECEVCLPLKSVPNNNSGAPSTSLQQTWPTQSPQIGQSTNMNHVPGPSSSQQFPNSFNNGLMDRPTINQNTHNAQAMGSMPNGINVPQVPGMSSHPGQATDGNIFHMPRIEREWHRDVTEELRNHLVQKLVQAIFPTPQKVSLTDERMRKLVNFARKVECDMYEAANNRSEYYHLLAEKIYKIQKELEEKRAMRNRNTPGNRMITPDGSVRVPNISGQVPGMRVPNANMSPRMTAPSMRLNQPITNPAIGQNKAIEQMLQNPSANQNSQLDIAGDQAMAKFQMATSEIRQQRTGENQLSNPQQFNTQSNPMQDAIRSNSGAIGSNSIGGVFGSQSDIKPTLTQNNIDPMPQGQANQGDQNGPSSLGMSSSTTSAQPRLERLLRETNPSAPSSSAGVTSTSGFYSSSNVVNQPTQPQQRPMYSTNTNPSKNQHPSSLQEILQGSGPSTVASTASSMVGSFVALTSTNTATSNVLTSPPPFVGEKKSGNLPSAAYSAPASNNSTIKAEVSVDPTASVKSENPGSNKGGFSSGGKSWSPSRNKVSVKSEPNQSEPDDKFPSMNQAESTTLTATTNHGPFVKPEKTEAPPSGKSKTTHKVFDPLELKVALLPVLEKLYMLDPESVPFRQPVDPHELNIPDYFDIVKEPMDLSSIRKGLETGKYKEPWEFIADVWLMFNNAWLYNRRTTRIYKYCTKLKDVFEIEIDPVMQRLGYCCGRKLEFMPMTLCCYGKQLCTIPTGAVYYDYQNRYDYCEKCFNEIPGDTISLADDPSQPQSSLTTIPKSKFDKRKNDVLDPEPFEVCNVCGRKMHKICVLHMAPIWPEGFTCNECLSRRGAQRKPNRYVASKLPQNKLSEHIERRVNGYIKRTDTTGIAGHVHIRVVYSGDKTVEVRPGMKTKFVDTKEMPETFPYRAKAFFAFEEIDGVDVCFFGVHVQEYGSDAPRPNQRRVYLSYLDSVHFFRPRHLRTAVYHEILIGYFEYCKNLGYEFAHIWACPPCEGDDYIFHCHPPEQKIPKPKRLQDWYKKMLDKAISEQVIVDYKDIFHQAKDDRLQSARELPYFEGDFWPNVLEESIKEIEQEEEDRKRAEANEQAAAEEALLFKFSPLQNDQGGSSGLKNGNQNKKSKKANIKKTSQRTAKKKAPQVMNDLSDKLYQIMEKHKEVFFVIRLNTIETISKMGPTTDPDNTLQCDLMDGRDAFLTMAREKHFEFSSLRRAKWSSMAMLIELHTSGQDKFTYQCNKCRNSVETRYQCTVCHDFDLCIPCYKTTGHEHKMDKVGFGIDDGTLGVGSGSSTNKSGQISVDTCLRSLVHACQCKNANCNMPACYTMKKVLQHAKNCKKKSQGTCLICKQLIALCYYHARHCQEAKCPVAFCQNIKAKMKEQERQHRMRQQHLMKRRMMVMTQKSNPQSGPHTPAGNVSNTSISSQPSPKVNTNPENMPQQMQSGQKMHSMSSQGMMISPQGDSSMSSPMINQTQIASPSMNPGSQGHMGKPGSVLTQHSPAAPQTSILSPGQMRSRNTNQSSPPEAAVRAAEQARLVAQQQARTVYAPTSVQNPSGMPVTRPMGQVNAGGNQNPNHGAWSIGGSAMRPTTQMQPNNSMGGTVPQTVSTNPGIMNGPRGARPRNPTQLMDYLKKNPHLMNQIMQHRRMANSTPRQPMNAMPNQINSGMQQQSASGMQANTMRNTINQQGINMQQPVNNIQQPMQWAQQQQAQPHRIQQQAQFQTPAPPYNQAMSQHRVMVRYQQQQRMGTPIRHQMGSVVMQPGMNPQMTNMQQSIQNTLQHHPNMNASTGVPPTQQMPGRPGMPQMPPHAMAGRSTPMNQNQGTVQQHMVSNMDQSFNVGAPQQTMMGANTFSHPAAQGTAFNATGNMFQTNVNQSLGHLANPNQGTLDGYGKMTDK